MEYYKQFNVVMNALDNRGELVSSIFWARDQLSCYLQGGLALAVFVSCLNIWLVHVSVTLCNKSKGQVYIGPSGPYPCLHSMK